MNDKEEKFWIVAFVNGTTDVLRNEDGNIKRFPSSKEADKAAEEKAKELGSGYQCAVMESISFRHGFMTTEKVFYKTSSVTSESNADEKA